MPLTAVTYATVFIADLSRTPHFTLLNRQTKTENIYVAMSGREKEGGGDTYAVSGAGTRADTLYLSIVACS